MTILGLNLNDCVLIILKDSLYVLGDCRKRFFGLGAAPVRKTSDQNNGGKERPARSSAHDTITGRSTNHRHDNRSSSVGGNAWRSIGPQTIGTEAPGVKFKSSKVYCS